MDDQTKQSSVPELPSDDVGWLVFLKDEGLEFLSVYGSIRDPSKRRLIAELTCMLAESDADA